MLRIHPCTSAKDAKRYYAQSLSRGDYYAAQDHDASDAPFEANVPTRAPREIAALWHGKGAERLGLAGQPVSKDVFGRLAENRHPLSNEALTPRTVEGRLAGWDMNFHAPKGLSLLDGLLNRHDLRRLLLDAVTETMTEIESRVMTRVRTRGLSEDRITGELVYGAFLHDTSRPVDGVPDPHLHVHCFVFNATFDKVEDRWKAAKVRAIKREAPYFEAAFQARLAAKLRAHGIGLIKKGKSWELAGISDGLMRRFSRRTAEIEAVALRYNIDDPKLKAQLGAMTRKNKAKKLSRLELTELWRARLIGAEQRLLQRIASGEGPPHGILNPSADQAIEHALSHHLERASAVAVPRLLETALRLAPGAVSPEQAKAALAKRTDLIRREREEQVFVTLESVLKEERAVIGFAREGKAACARLDRGQDWEILDHRLNRGQQAAVRHVLSSLDRIMLIRGGAGTGKTTLLKEATTALTARGHGWVVLAPTAEASRGVLRREGFAHADTIERFLTNAELHAQAAQGVIWIDEAGLVGTRTLQRVFAVAEKLSARVVLMGDVKQHAPVERGDALRLLVTQAGLLPAEVLEVVRQREKYKAAVEALSGGRVGEALARLDAMGSVIELPDPQRHTLLAKELVEALRQRKSCLVIAPTHHEGKCLTVEIRKSMRAAGMIGASDTELRRLRELRHTLAERQDPGRYLPGEIVQFHHRLEADGVQLNPGSQAVVIGTDLWGGILAELKDGRRIRLPLDRASGFKVYAEEPITVAPGEVLRITRNGMARDGRTPLNNGEIVEVAAVAPGGHLRLADGRFIDSGFGHVSYGYVTTSHASQGRTCDLVFIAQGAQSVGAASREQFYVSASRGREGVRIFTDDRASLWESVQRVSERLSATELVAEPKDVQQDRKLGAVRNVLLERAFENQRRAVYERAKASQRSSTTNGRPPRAGAHA